MIARNDGIAGITIFILRSACPYRSISTHFPMIVAMR